MKAAISACHLHTNITNTQSLIMGKEANRKPKKLKMIPANTIQ